MEGTAREKTVVFETARSTYQKNLKNFCVVGVKLRLSATCVVHSHTNGEHSALSQLLSWDTGGEAGAGWKTPWPGGAGRPRDPTKGGAGLGALTLEHPLPPPPFPT